MTSQRVIIGAISGRQIQQMLCRTASNHLLGREPLAVKRRTPMRVRIVLAFFVLAATSLLAQTFRGTILGTVTDPSGAVVAGAKVVVRNVATGLERTTQTSADGSYS